MKLAVVVTLAAVGWSSAATANSNGISQGSQWFSEITAQVLANMTNDYNQFQHMVTDRTAQLTRDLQDAENNNAAVERQSAAVQHEISSFQQKITSLKGVATHTTQENQYLRKKLQVLSEKMRAAQAAAEAAVEGSDGGEAAAIAAAEAPSAVASPQQQQPLANQQFAPVQPAFANSMPQAGDLVEQPHNAEEDEADDGSDADSPQEAVVQPAVANQPQVVPPANALYAAQPANTGAKQPQTQQVSQLQQQQFNQQQQQRMQDQRMQEQEDDGYNVAFASDDAVDPDAAYSFLEVKRFPLRKRNMLRSGRVGATQIRSQVVSSGGQIVSMLTQQGEQYAQQEEYNVATLQNSYQGAMVLLSRRNAELLAQQSKLTSTRDSLQALHTRLSGTVSKLEATRGRLQKHVAELEGMFRQLGHGSEAAGQPVQVAVTAPLSH